MIYDIYKLGVKVATWNGRGFFLDFQDKVYDIGTLEDAVDYVQSVLGGDLGIARR